jgi:hypothetical protein
LGVFEERQGSEQLAALDVEAGLKTHPNEFHG